MSFTVQLEIERFSEGCSGMLFKDGVAATEGIYARSHSHGKRLLASLLPSICPRVTQRLLLDGFFLKCDSGG
jgi:hypothetical protein